MQLPPRHFCTACFDGKYPIKIPKRRSKHVFESEKVKNLAKSKFIKLIMRYSQFFVPTTKEIPNDAEIISHQLMIRAGYIQRVASVFILICLSIESFK